MRSTRRDVPRWPACAAGVALLLAGGPAGSQQRQAATIVLDQGADWGPWIVFGARLPRAGEALDDALVDPVRVERVLREAADVMARHPSLGVLRVSGFADADECASTDCLAVSARRASMVRDRLVAYGVDADRLAVESHAASRPLENGPGEHPRNRRVELDPAAPAPAEKRTPVPE